MHLMNILNQLEANKDEKTLLITQFKDKTVSNASVKEALEQLRN